MEPATTFSWHEAARWALVYAGSAAVRLVPLALLAAGLLAAFRVRRPAVRHAVWAIVLAGLLALPLLQWALPPLSLRLSRSHAVRLFTATPVLAPALLPREAPSFPALAPEVPKATRRFDPVEIAAIVWILVALAGLGRMACGLWAARKLADEASTIVDDRLTRIREESAAALGMPAPYAPVLETPRISVPLALGHAPGCVLLPADWRSWDDSTLRAALAHEMAHLRRRDWRVRLWSLAARSIFWFHPVVWWLEQHLSVLAETCCDEEGVRAVGDPARYAGVLLEFARVASPVRGRMVLADMSMARSGVRGSTMKHRLDRILRDELPGRGIVRASAVALSLLLALPLIYAAAALQLSDTPAPEKLPISSHDELVPREAMSRRAEPQPVSLDPQEIKRLEESLLTQPKDETIRGRLIAHYYLNADAENYKRHVFWLIENLPESEFACRKSMGFQDEGLMVSTQDVERAHALWQRQAARHSDSAPILLHAAIFFEYQDPFLAERWLLHARELETPDDEAFRELVSIYMRAAYGIGGGPWDGPGTAFPAHVAEALESTNDARIAGLVGQSMSMFRPMDWPSELPKSFIDQQRNRGRVQSDATKAFAEKCLKRAVELDPANPRWQVTLARLQGLDLDKLYANQRQH